MILLSTSSLDWYGIHRIFAFAKKAGFYGIDLCLDEKDYDNWDEEYLKSLSKSFWVPVLSVTAPDKGLDEKKVNKIVKIAENLEAQIVTFSPPHISDKNTTWFTKYLSKVVKNTNIWISIKNVEPKFLFFIIPEYKNAWLPEIKKVTWNTSLDIWAIDSGSSVDIIKAQTIFWSSIKNIYLSDKYGTKTWLLPGDAWGWISYLPLESFFMKLKTMAYNWFVSLQVKPSELWVWDEKKVLEKLKYAIDYYTKYFVEQK